MYEHIQLSDNSMMKIQQTYDIYFLKKATPNTYVVMYVLVVYFIEEFTS